MKEYTCKTCGAVFTEDDAYDMEETLWGHIQDRHPDVFEEVECFETPDMIEECYDEEDV